MSVETLISIDEYLRTSFDPDCDYVDGHVEERNVGKRKHSYAQARIAAWFIQRGESLQVEALTEQRTKVAAGRVRIPDVVVLRTPSSDEEVLTEPPFICIEVMSPEDTISGMQERMDDYLDFGVENIWVVDPWKRRAWTITRDGWRTSLDQILRTHDGSIAMPLKDVLM
jgi:Uma2 family endonuclease